MKRIGVVTVARSDYSILRPILRGIETDSKLELCLFASGMHLSPEFGMTIHEIEKDGLPIAHRVEMLLSSDSASGVAKSIGIGVAGFAQAFEEDRPDILLVLGDRFEMLAAAVAALPMRIPVAHVHGGENTVGAIDDTIRHAITKLSHVHFVSTEAYARRLRQLGEEPSRVTVCGAPSLDNLRPLDLLDLDHFRSEAGIADLPDKFLLTTFHPATLESTPPEAQLEELLQAIRGSGFYALFTAPNADAGGRTLMSAIRAYVDRNPTRGALVPNLGPRAYYSAMALACAMVGNSSSGIIESPSLLLPVVNVGSRQEGRLRAENVIDVAPNGDAILAGIRRAVSVSFREALKGLRNPYDCGGATRMILQVLRNLPNDGGLLTKRFVDIRMTEGG